VILMAKSLIAHQHPDARRPEGDPTAISSAG